MLSKTTEGLFTKVIPESGAAVGITGVDPIEHAKNTAQILGFTEVDDIYSLQKFYQDTPVDIFDNTYVVNPNSTYGFIPCVERDTGAEVFLDGGPVNILKEGKYKKMDMVSLIWNDQKDKINDKFSNFLPANEERQKVAKMVKELYFSDKPIDEKAILGYVDFFTDITFAYPTFLSAQLHAEADHDQVYRYEYSYVDEDTPFVTYTNVR